MSKSMLGKWAALFSLAAIAFMLLVNCVLAAGAAAAPAGFPIRIVLGNRVLHFQQMQPREDRGTTYVPLRGILEKMGYSVQYAKGKITYRNGQSGVIDLKMKTLQENAPGAVPEPLDIKVVHNVTLVSVRSLSGIMHNQIGWNSQQRTVMIDARYSSFAAAVPVLMLHSIVPAKYDKKPKNDAVMTLEHFKADMDYLHVNGYHTITLPQLEQFVDGNLALPPKSIVITFDDGYQDNYVYAYPILKKYGFHAAMFLIGKSSPEKAAKYDPNVLTHISWQEIKEAGDVFKFHSHTYNLHTKMRFPNGSVRCKTLDPTLLQADIIKMKKRLDTPYFCFPYGDYDAQSLAILKKNGYRMAFTVHQGFVRPGDDPMTLRRLTVDNKTVMSRLLGKLYPPEDGSGLAAEEGLS